MSDTTGGTRTGEVEALAPEVHDPEMVVVLPGANASVPQLRFWNGHEWAVAPAPAGIVPETAPSRTPLVVHLGGETAQTTPPAGLEAAREPVSERWHDFDTLAPPTVPESERRHARRRIWGILGLVLLVVLAALLIAGIVRILVSGNPLKGTVQSVSVLNSSQVAVNLQVVNTGSSSHRPVCAVNVGTSDGSGHGIATIKPSESLLAHAARNYRVVVTVTNSAAGAVRGARDVNVTCA